MKHQQQAEKEEQQRIKSLVLNYDLRESEDQDGELNFATPNSSSSIHTLSTSGTDRPSSFHLNRLNNNPGKGAGQRARKLQISDVADWYDHPSRAPFEHRNFNQRTHWTKSRSRRDHRTSSAEGQGFTVAEHRQGTRA
jgi:regulator of nonsense transcripts 2